MITQTYYQLYEILQLNNRLLSSNDLRDKLSVSRSMIDKLTSSIGFPAPIVLGEKSKRWLEADVDKWIEEQKVKVS